MRSVVSGKSRLIVGWGFGLVLLLVLLLVLAGLSRLASVMHVAEALSREQAVKTELLTKMQLEARQRFVSLYRMSIETDAFQRDAEFMDFRQHGNSFVDAQESFRNLSLAGEEVRLLDTLRPLLAANGARQNQVAEWLLDGKTEAANQLLRSQVIPTQDRILQGLNQLLEIQRIRASATLQQMAAQNQKIFGLMALMATFVILAGAAIAWYVYRRTGEIESHLFAEKERAEVTLHSISDAVITVDNELRINYLNPVAEAITGWLSGNAVGRYLQEVFNPLHELRREPVSLWHGSDLPDAQTVGLHRHALLITPAGHECVVETEVAPLRDNSGRKTGLVLAFRDVTYARQLAHDLAWAASHDALTGLYNRREFELRLSEWLRATRSGQLAHAMLYLDLDQFKLVNDTSGHMAGDELLKSLTAQLVPCVREGDMLARLGGDEFGVLLHNVTLEDAAGIAENLREVVRSFRFVWQGQLFEVGVSIGVVPINQQSHSPASVMMAADAACYLAKEHGRNRIHVSQENDRDISFRREEMQWTQRITQALEENLFCLYYQKIVPVSGHGGEMHCEILLRMRGDNGEMISPMSFIPACERYSLMATVDRWVIRNALEWIKSEQHSNLIQTYFINLSGQSFNDDTFTAFVVQSIRASGVEPGRVGFEITETAAIANLDRALEFMRILLDMGCRFSLDDFGAGMSSFAYLKRFRVNKIKIDGMFVRNMVADEIDRAMVEAINRIGHVMGIQTVAEFVEDPAALRLLEDLGVDFAQGYSIHRPEPINRGCC